MDTNTDRFTTLMLCEKEDKKKVALHRIEPGSTDTKGVLQTSNFSILELLVFFTCAIWFVWILTLQENPTPFLLLLLLFVCFQFQSATTSTGVVRSKFLLPNRAVCRNFAGGGGGLWVF